MHTTREPQGNQYRSQVRRHARSIHSYDFFNLLTGPELLDWVDAQLPPHRERLYAPTDTLSLFMAQALNPDASCQHVVNRYAVERIANGLAPCSTHTGAFCKARQRLPLSFVQALVQHTGRIIAGQAQSAWQWQGRPVKLIDGTTVTMPDTPENQACFPQQSNQKPGLGFPISRIVGVLCLAPARSWMSRWGRIRGRRGASMRCSGNCWAAWLRAIWYWPTAITARTS